jgi:hypothetical protein
MTEEQYREIKEDLVSYIQSIIRNDIKGIKYFKVNYLSSEAYDCHVSIEISFRFGVISASFMTLEPLGRYYGDKAINKIANLIVEYEEAVEAEKQKVLSEKITAEDE